MECTQETRKSISEKQNLEKCSTLVLPLCRGIVSGSLRRGNWDCSLVKEAHAYWGTEDPRKGKRQVPGLYTCVCKFQGAG